MEFGILGPLEVREADRLLSVGGYKQRALLAILLTQANKVVSTDYLLQSLWGDHAPDTAGHSIQVYVSQLRKVLEPAAARGFSYQVLVSRPPGYMIKIEANQLDLDLFLRLLVVARAAAEVGDHESASDGFRRALALWRGPPLTEFVSEPFAIAEAGRLNEVRFRALEDRVDSDLRLGRHADLVGELQALLAEQPLRERLCGQLMLALYRSGRQAEASAVYQQARARLVDELGMEPGHELQNLLKQILNQAGALDLGPAASMRRERKADNLPLQLTSFVGRVQELADVTRLLSQSRLMTITGAGGVGKTRLAIHAADQLRESYRDGVWLVELAPVVDPNVVPQAVIAALGVREQARRSVPETLCDYLQTREQLLVLDNCEHLIDAAARLITVLLQTCPQLHILATSREALGIAGENAWRVPSLTVPDSRKLPSADRLSDYDAIALFVDRSTIALGHFSIDDENARLVAELCERLDGIPLAIELAAAKLKVLSLAQVAQRLSDRFRLLTGGSRTAMPRQQTLRAAIDWSYDLLSDAQQATLRRLSVFAGGISLEAAEAVCVEGVVEVAGLLDLLAELVAKSLLMVDRDRGDARYRVLETIRQYSGEKLMEAGEAELVRHRHRAWFQSLAERAEPEMRGNDQAAWFDRLEMEHDNLRAALGWSLGDGTSESSLRIAGAMGSFWRMRGDRAEGLRWLERALMQSVGSSHPRANVLYWTAALTSDLNDYARAAILAQDGLAICNAIGDRWGMARVEQMLGSIAARQDRYDEALAWFHKSLTTFQEIPDPWGEGWACYSIGFVWWARGDYERARGQFQNGLSLLRQAGDGHRTAMTQQMLGIVELCLGNYQPATTLIRKSLAPFQRLKDDENVAWSLVYLGVLSRCLKDYEPAMALLQDSLTHFREVNLKQGVGYALCEMGIVVTLQGDPIRADSLLKDSLGVLHSAVDRSATAKVLEAMAEIAALLGKLDRSATLLGAAESLRTTIEAPIELFEADGYRRLVSTITQGLSKPRFAQAWAAGHVMKLEETVKFAMRGLDEDGDVAGNRRQPN